MIILHLTKKYYPMIGGDAYAVNNLKREQVEIGHKVFVLTSNCDEIIQSEDVFKYGLKNTSANLDKITVKRIVSLFCLFFVGFRLLRKLKPEIIHSHSADLGFFISFAAKFYKIPVVNTCHGISFDDNQYFFLKRLAEKFFLKHSGFKWLIVVDRNGFEILKKAGIKNGIYVPNGVDIHKFKKQSKEKMGEKTRFLFVGRLEKQKGLEHLIKAAKILCKNNDFELIIVGDGKEAEILKRDVIENGVDDVVKFNGKLSEQELIQQYFRSDIFVLPSLWEGLPLTLLEAAAAGMPIIATEVGGISSVFSHGKNAILVKAGESGELVREMQRLKEDKKLRDTLGINARKLAEEYSWEKSAKELDSIYMSQGT